MIPAQVTRMSRPPCSSTVFATAPSTAARSVTFASSLRPGASSSKPRSTSGDLRAFRLEPLRRRLADPAAAAGDERDLPLEAIHAA